MTKENMSIIKEPKTEKPVLSEAAEKLAGTLEVEVTKKLTRTLEIEILSLKSKVEALRSNNNSYLYSALVKFQSEMPIVIKNSTVYGNQKYASFAHIKRLATPILSKYGLYIGQDLITVDDKDAIKTYIAHVSGQCRESVFVVPVFLNEKTQNPRNEVAGSITFFMRRAYSSSLGIVTEEE